MPLFLAFLEDVGFNVIVLLAAGLVWFIGKVMAGAKALREHTRARMDQQDRERRLDFDDGPKAEPLAQREPPPPEPVRRPPSTRRTPPPRTGPHVLRRSLVPQRAAKGEVPPSIARLRDQLGDRESLRAAVVLREILGPPKALRGVRGRRNY